MQNRLNKQEALVVQACHHGLDALPAGEAAKKLDVSVRTIQRLLKSAEKKAPQLFPILSANQAQILHWYTVEGMSVSQIAMMKDVNESTVYATIAKLRDKKVLNDDRPSRPVSFDEAAMSGSVVKKW